MVTHCKTQNKKRGVGGEDNVLGFTLLFCAFRFALFTSLMARINTDKEIRENLYNPCNPCAIGGVGGKGMFLVLHCYFAPHHTIGQAFRFALFTSRVSSVCSVL